MGEDRLEVRRFLERFIRTDDLRDDMPIFASGYVNSLFAIQLVMFLEKTVGVPVATRDLKLENFETIDAIVNFISRKRSGMTVEAPRS